MTRNVFAIIDDLGRGLSELKNALSPLASLTGGDGPFPIRRGRSKTPKRSGRRVVQRKAAPAATPTKAKRPRKPISAAVKAKRVLQGRYLAALRPLSKAQRAKIKNVFVKGGHKAAIRAAQRMR